MRKALLILAVTVVVFQCQFSSFAIALSDNPANSSRFQTLAIGGPIRLRDYVLSADDAEPLSLQYATHPKQTFFSRPSVTDPSLETAAKLGERFSDAEVAGLETNKSPLLEAVVSFNKLSNLERADLQLYTRGCLLNKAVKNKICSLGSPLFCG